MNAHWNGDRGGRGLRWVRSVCGLLCVLAAFGPGGASAQTADGGGYDLRLFRPAVDSKGIISVNGTDILGHKDYSFGFVLDGAFKLLPFHGFALDEGQPEAEADRTTYLVDNYFTGVLHFNYGIKNWAVVGLQLPIVLANGPNVSVPGFYNDGANPGGYDYQGIGNMVLHGKVRFLRAEQKPMGLAAVVRLGLPTGDSERLAGEPSVSFWPSLVAEARVGRRVRFDFEVGYKVVAGDGASLRLNGETIPMPGVGNATMPILSEPGYRVTYGDQLTFGVGGAFRISPDVDFVLEGYGAQLTDFGQKGSASLEALGGLKIFVQENSYLLMAGGPGITAAGRVGADGFNTPSWRFVIGFIFEPSIGDRDGDGYKDDVDSCPDDPEDFDGFEDADGCPDPDNDKDGIPDVDDECPLIPEDYDGDADEDGCPDGMDGDRDGDGIPDSVDQCPDDPEDLDGFQDQDGCPDPDNDKDGILDVDDLCPMDPEDMDGFEDEDGCPDLDNDGDRILDVDDACPNDPETYNGFEDEDGCPDRGSVIIEDNQIVILEKIYFETDSAEIQKRSYPIVDAVAATLIGNPQIELIEIQGHADERGSDDYNLRLTRDRAAAVLEALARRGVMRDRVRSGGYGERCPIDPGHTPEAWERNRRVEFKIIRTEEGPTGVEVACPAGRSLIPD